MKILRIVVILLLLAAGGIYFLYQKSDGKILLEQPFLQETLKLDNQKIEEFAQSTSSELETLTERGKEVGEHAQNVLGRSVEVNEEQPALHERALEYGRYVYCQQVVEEYESQK